MEPRAWGLFTAILKIDPFNLSPGSLHHWSIRDLSAKVVLMGATGTKECLVGLATNSNFVSEVQKPASLMHAFDHRMSGQNLRNGPVPVPSWVTILRVLLTIARSVWIFGGTLVVHTLRDCLLYQEKFLFNETFFMIGGTTNPKIKIFHIDPKVEVAILALQRL